MLLNRLYNFQNLETAQADQVDAELDQIILLLNGKLSGDNFKDGGIPLSKLDSAIGSIGGSLIDDATTSLSKTWSSTKINTLSTRLAEVEKNVATTPNSAPPSAIVNPKLLTFPNFPQLQQWYNQGYALFGLDETILIREINERKDTMPKLYAALFVRAGISSVVLIMSDSLLSYDYTGTTATITNENSTIIAHINTSLTGTNESASLSFVDVQNGVDGTPVKFFQIGYSQLEGTLIGAGGASVGAAVDVAITDAGSYFASNNVEGALQELGSQVASGGGGSTGTQPYLSMNGSLDISGDFAGTQFPFGSVDKQNGITYDATTKQVTLPSTGVYMVSVLMRADQVFSANINICFQLKYGGISRADDFLRFNFAQGTNESSLSGSTIVFHDYAPRTYEFWIDQFSSDNFASFTATINIVKISDL